MGYVSYRRSGYTRRYGTRYSSYYRPAKFTYPKRQNGSPGVVRAGYRTKSSFGLRGYGGVGSSNVSRGRYRVFGNVRRQNGGRGKVQPTVGKAVVRVVKDKTVRGFGSPFAVCANGL